jgi:hypothetical protein
MQTLQARAMLSDCASQERDLVVQEAIRRALDVLDRDVTHMQQ